MEKKKDAKKTRLYVRVSEDEKNQTLRKMRMAGMVNISEYARRMLLRGRVLLFDMTELKEVSELLKQGRKEAECIYGCCLRFGKCLHRGCDGAQT